MRLPPLFRARLHLPTRRPLARVQFPALDSVEIVKHQAAEWNKLPEAEKARYAEEATADIERYKQECAAAGIELEMPRSEKRRLKKESKCAPHALGRPRASWTRKRAACGARRPCGAARAAHLVRATTCPSAVGISTSLPCPSALLLLRLTGAASGGEGGDGEEGEEAEAVEAAPAKKKKREPKAKAKAGLPFAIPEGFRQAAAPAQSALEFGTPEGEYLLGKHSEACCASSQHPSSVAHASEAEGPGSTAPRVSAAQN